MSEQGTQNTGTPHEQVQRIGWVRWIVASAMLALALFFWQKHDWHFTESHALVAGVLAYIGVVIVGRWVFIGGPARAHYRQRIESLEATMYIDSKVIAKAKSFVPTENTRWFSNFSDFLTLNRGAQLAGWEFLHSIERSRILNMAEGEVNARLDGVVAELKATKAPSADELRLRINAFRTPEATGSTAAIANGNTENSEAKANYGKALLMTATEALHDAVDTLHARRAALARKMFWLTIAGSVAVGIVGLSFDHHKVLLLGAVGGVLSRLSAKETLGPKAIEDYGAGWTKLFSAPVIGALGSFFVLQTIAGLGHAGFLGPAICPVIVPVQRDFGLAFPATTTTTSIGTSTTTLGPAATTTSEPAPDRPGDRAWISNNITIDSFLLGTVRRTALGHVDRSGDDQVRTQFSLRRDTTFGLPPDINNASPASTTTPPTTTTTPTTTPTTTTTLTATTLTATTTTTPTTTTTTTSTTAPAKKNKRTTIVNPDETDGNPRATVPPLCPATEERNIPIDDDPNDDSPVTLGLACVLGFSERLFARLLNRTANAIESGNV